MTGGPPHDLSAARIVDAIQLLEVLGSRPVVIGISGYGGAGKSTLARQLQSLLPGCAVVPGDEFLLSRPPTRRSDDWGDVDRRRLVDQVLAPARRGEAPSYQVLDPETMELGPWVSLVDAEVVVVEGLGLFTPELVDLFDVKVWIDVALATATAQGMWRDEHEYGNAQADLWLEVWQPNDADFFARFRPDLAADVHYRPAESLTG